MDKIQFLGNEAIHQLLINLTKDEAITFRNVIEKTFEDFSVAGERQYQPDPTSATRPNGQRTLFRPFTSDLRVGAKIVIEAGTGPDGKKIPLHGVLILIDGQGNPTGVLSAEEVTGYRTSMNAMVPFSWRNHVDNIVIFGGRMQALWHTRLILTLRGSEVKTITFVNPSKDRVDKLIETVLQENEARWKSKCTFHFIDTTASDYQEQVKKRLSDTDCVFCTTPSRKPLFPANYLTERRHSIRQPFVSAIGSWQSDMIELDPALLHYAITAEGVYNPCSGEGKGVLLVDDLQFALENSGEIVQSKLTANDLVELGQIIALMSGKIKPLNDQQVLQTNQFVSQGFVVYKSVGVSLTDLTTANAILALNEKKNCSL
ncbi:uncharacterized protein N7496_002640 [Penicillium cataractarum]|uniref:Ornithine cyclodeaminase n=1 Tax=Penicillium cataractarum TaxID=2100454 RepID=A0A9W9SKL5_9EURO|nr:uncharacterized protein N7496_002640 [Penicillium cataractarum]KAJ5380212.1 hypothetical protein N7496_002640 [Penicillium cataractarum]